MAREVAHDRTNDLKIFPRSLPRTRLHPTPACFWKILTLASRIRFFKEISEKVDYVMHISFKNTSLILIIIRYRMGYVIIALECQLLYQ